MSEKALSRNTTIWTGWRITRWASAAALLLTPLVMMQVSPDWNWSIGDFLVAGTVIGGVGLLYELAERISDRRPYRIGAAIALGTCFLLIWSTLVRDDGNGIGFFLIVMAAGVAAFAGQLAAAAMARAMLGITVMQALCGLAVATAPDVARVSHASIFYLVYTIFFCTLWLAAAVCFRRVAQVN